MRVGTFSMRLLPHALARNQGRRALVVAIVLMVQFLCSTAPATDARITTYYWDAGWVEHASWTSTYGEDLTINIDAWNWADENPPPGEDPTDFPALNVKFDNVITNDGLLDDFDDGIINSLWQVHGTIDTTSVAETDGVLEIDIPEGPSPSNPDLNQVGGVRTKEAVLHGHFDIQVDFSLNPEYHTNPRGTANAKLILTDASGHQVVITIRSGVYESVDLLKDHSSYIVKAETATSDLDGKLRITRTPLIGPIAVDIYSDHSEVEGGAPYSNLVMSFKSPDIMFGTNTGFQWHPLGGYIDFGAEITGCLDVADDGIYEFGLESDDGSMLYIDGVLVVDNGGGHPPLLIYDQTFLTAGNHSFRVEFFDGWCCASGVDLILPNGVMYAPCVIEIEIDIKPGSFPNSINLKSTGVVPVAILGTDGFSASEVDPAAVIFADAPPVHWALEDVDSDGDMDMILHFKTQELALDSTSTEATLIGATKDGTALFGIDSVRIVSKPK